MKGRNVFGLTFSVMLLLLATGSGLAGGPQPTGPSETAAANASPGATAAWFNIEVDTPNDTGQHTSVVVDQTTGGIYVSYYDANAKDLRIAQYVRSGGNCGPNLSWFCRTIDSEGDVGKYSSIAISPGAGLTRITYYDATNGDLKIAKANFPLHPLSVWPTYTIDKGVYPASTGLHTSLKLDPISGAGHVSYYFSDPNGVDKLMIASWVGSGGNCGYGLDEGEWQCDIIQEGEGLGQYTSLALDGNGDTHIAYYDGGNRDLWYATNRTGSNCGPGNTWTCYPVTGSTTDVGQYASMYVDDGGHFHIAYYDATAEKLKYAVELASGVGNCGVLGSAQCDTIDSMPADYHPLGVSIAEDADGYPIIAYQSENGSLNMARPVAALGLPAGSGNCGPEDLFQTWMCETIDRHSKYGATYRNADFVSIALSPSGLATIAYYRLYTDFADGNLMVAYQRFQVFQPLVMKNQ